MNCIVCVVVCFCTCARGSAQRSPTPAFCFPCPWTQVGILTSFVSSHRLSSLARGCRTCLLEPQLAHLSGHQRKPAATCTRAESKIVTNYDSFLNTGSSFEPPSLAHIRPRFGPYWADYKNIPRWCRRLTSNKQKHMYIHVCV